MLATHCNSAYRFNRLLLCPTIEPLMYNTLQLKKNSTENECFIGQRDSDLKAAVSIKMAGFDDIMNHTAKQLEELVAGKRILINSRIDRIYDVGFRLPVSQYVAVWRHNEIDLYACDPAIENLLINLYRLHDKNEDNDTMAKIVPEAV